MFALRGADAREPPASDDVGFPQRSERTPLEKFLAKLSAVELAVVPLKEFASWFVFQIARRPDFFVIQRVVVLAVFEVFFNRATDGEAQIGSYGDVPQVE